jgi:hypothetical protein
MKITVTIAALALLAGTGALAEGGQDQTAKAEKKICKTERVTGSLTRVNKVCMTKAEWDNLAQSSRKGIDDQIRQSGIAGNGDSSTAGL